MWVASKVTAEGVASAPLIFGLFLRGTEKISFLEGLKKKGGVSKRLEDLVAIFFVLGGKSRVTSFIAPPGVSKLNGTAMSTVVFFLPYLSFQKNDLEPLIFLLLSGRRPRTRKRGCTP